MNWPEGVEQVEVLQAPQIQVFDVVGFEAEAEVAVVVAVVAIVEL